MAEDLYSAILNSAARNAARQEMDTTALDRLAMEQQLARILAGQRRRERQAEIWPGGTFTLVEPEKRPSNALYEVLSNARLNRGLENLAGNTAEVIFGEPTGNAVIDYGVSNIPGVGAVAIGAGGGQPGLIDILGGIGAPLKGMAVIAKPLASQIIRRAAGTIDADLGAEAIYMVAKGAMDKLARGGTRIDPDQIIRTVEGEMSLLKDAKDADLIRGQAIDILRDNVNRVNEEISMGRVPNLDIKMPEKVLAGGKFIASKTADELKEQRRLATAAYRAKKKAQFDALPDDVKKSIKDEANAAYDEAYKKAVADGNSRPGDPAKAAYNAVMAARLRKIDLDERGHDIEKIASRVGVGTEEQRMELKNRLGEIREQAYNDAIANGFNTDEAHAIAKKAYNRAQHQLMKEISPEMADAKKAQQAARARNLTRSRERFSDDVTKDINELAEQEYQMAYDEAIRNGASEEQAKYRAKYKRQNAQNILAKDFLKDFGFTGPNDPRISNYKVIGRTPEESVMLDIDEVPEAIERELVNAPVSDAATEVQPIIEQTPSVAGKIMSAAAKGGPNQWKKNGWTSEKYNPRFFEQFGGNLAEDSKRDVYVVDSLAKHWAKMLFADPSFAEINIPPRGVYDPAKTRQGARHDKTNYNTVSEGFTKDVIKNIESGNMPGKAVKFKPLYDPNGYTRGKEGPVLILSDKEAPMEFTNPRIWPIQQAGPGLYDLLFRTRTDRILHNINPSYWESITKW